MCAWCVCVVGVCLGVFVGVSVCAHVCVKDRESKTVPVCVCVWEFMINMC